MFKRVVWMAILAVIVVGAVGYALYVRFGAKEVPIETVALLTETVSPPAETVARPVEEIKMKRVKYMEWGFSIELPEEWERLNQKAPDYSFYLCQTPLEKNETDPKAKINMIVGSKKAEYDDEYFFEKTLMGVTGQEIDRGTITIEDPNRKMPGKWIHYLQQRVDRNDVKVLAYKIIEEDVVYLIICYADSDEYENYEALFKKVVMSLRSEKIKIGE